MTPGSLPPDHPRDVSLHLGDDGPWPRGPVRDRVLVAVAAEVPVAAARGGCLRLDSGLRLVGAGLDGKDLRTDLPGAPGEAKRARPTRTSPPSSCRSTPRTTAFMQEMLAHHPQALEVACLGGRPDRRRGPAPARRAHHRLAGVESPSSSSGSPTGTRRSPTGRPRGAPRVCPAWRPRAAGRARRGSRAGVRRALPRADDRPPPEGADDGRRSVRRRRRGRAGGGRAPARSRPIRPSRSEDDRHAPSRGEPVRQSVPHQHWTRERRARSEGTVGSAQSSDAPAVMPVRTLLGAPRSMGPG